MHSHADRLLAEIGEQPTCLSQLLSNFPDNVDGIAMPGDYADKLIGIAEGSSYNALKIAAPFVEELTGLNQFTFDPESLDNKFEVAHWVNQPIKRLFQHSFFVAVSQSGETASVLKVVQRLQKLYGFSDQYSPMVSFTNNPQGTLCRRYGNHFYLAAGDEKSIAATKSMTASIMALLLFGLRCGQKREWLKRGFFNTFRQTLVEIPETLAQLLADTALQQRLQAFAKALCDTNQFILLSKGPMASILPEAGLKLTETSRNIVWTDNTESFKHGRKVMLYGVRGVRPNCVYVVPPGLSKSAVDSFFQDIHAHFFTGDEQIFSSEGVFFIRFENSPALPEALKTALRITEAEILELPASQGVESLFVGIVVFQLLSYYLALAKGEDPNNPALQKAVTR